MSKLRQRPRVLFCWVLLVAMLLSMLPHAALAAGPSATPLSVKVTNIGETGATLTITDENNISGTKFAIYKVQEKGEPAPGDATGFTDLI